MASRRRTSREAPPSREVTPEKVYYFEPNFERIGVIGLPEDIRTDEDLTEALMLENSIYSATPEFARKHGGRLAHAFLDQIPDWYVEEAIAKGLLPNIDVRVHRNLQPGDFPAYPGWHCDGELRETYFSQPDLDRTPVSRHVTGVLSNQYFRHGVVTNPEFLVNPYAFQTKPQSSEHMLWGMIDEELRTGQPKETTVMRDGELMMFDSRSLHRVMPAQIQGARLFFRLSQWHKPNLGDGGLLAKQDQLYRIWRPREVGTETQRARFEPSVTVIERREGVISIADLEKEYAFENASADFVETHGGPLAKELLSRVPSSFYEEARRKNLDVRFAVSVYRLYPTGDHPGNPSWHCGEDSESNTLVQDGKPGIILTLSSHETGVSPILFARQPVELGYNDHATWNDVHAQIERQNIATSEVPDGTMVGYEPGTLHKVQETRMRGWRFCFQAVMSNKPLPKNGGLLVREAPVYKKEDKIYSGW
ncbi:MAG: hypothetical protein COW24_02445 [Candidatus Kerfeldbacteria bacterium CG15_BIG_FIL_POST_REV_8_21_14_020_45_12]|uniref:Uncharacterized protein n=1 Tax=Candidatus Kerfeldbacteria bacterium CG15_BIG_FIL_POST_REV_8_21_14_020_45_12 TaxID=2014247 RepID=A0A2M7H439_9BACT|nr:MAG: hypothetical protein COW24_02445 [Candidatus Kerfeldbacteria bacterium CG15_BIG_FIL_POST_REV_8_21_14_020_45_12]PJA92861.1 MAG: hypothetical protein CO132_05680 [Candidatus Kerfeldbacteria bacterium CG_4_9_14_3_um_filter_45_8]